MTGLHVLHFIGGLLLFFSFGCQEQNVEKDPERFINRIEIVGLYWHFVDLVWIFLFPVLYLL
ncbi:MAG: hypothetical protein Ct9H300mP18_09750 [Candidatus Neomarinimicrobiota bacterium]|nr:MAG: hypothetical protein Ct9H300mP18_09750 [Candidatus Neomarinimicrobiota bacterium]